MVNLRTTLRTLSTSRNPTATHSLRFLTTTHLCHRADTQLRIWQRKMEAKERYRDWTKESLVSRIAELEAQTTALGAVQAKKDTAAHVASLTPDLSTTNASTLIEEDIAQGQDTGKEGKKKAKGGKKEKKPKEFDFATSPCRKIALRFSYDGAGYSGLAAQNTSGPGSGSTLPTVEAVLWDALCTARLVDPAMGMDGAGFSRCGRTDRGVSAAGQVVALWVRSKKVNQWRARISHTEQFSPSTTSSPFSKLSLEELDQLESKQNTRLEPVELPYVAILNRILPTSIRIQAWSPVRSNFSSRFDCTYRHYKYFFPRGPPKLFFPPHIDSSTSSSALIDSGATRLDIEGMRDAATRLLGEHDFRNLCKIDASKQITNYRRRIDGVSIDRVSSHWPTSSVVVEGEEKEQEGEGEGEGEREEMYVLNLRGTAFLYHQVRNIMAILFLVGARLEKPNVIEELMNTEHGAIAADRVKMRLAATSALRPTANSKLGNNDEPPVAQEEGEGAIKWWLPINATCTSCSCTSSAIETPQGLPMWIQTTLNNDASTHQTSDSSLEIYATKPNYEMAADRPLVLWECGFLACDVEWRVGPYDGSLQHISAEEQNENLATASSSLLRVHKCWTQLAISTELTRHFILASPSAHKGTLSSRTTFEDASFPFLPTVPSNMTDIDEELRQMENKNKGQAKEKVARAGIPLGNGTGRGASNYIPLEQRAREETYQVKNQRWAQTTGKRRSERKEAELAVMIRDKQL